MAIYFANEFLKKEDFREVREERKERKISIFKCLDHPILLYLLLNFFLFYIAVI